MYIHLHNENYGYSTATYGDYVSVGNPSFLRHVDGVLDTDMYSGSIDCFQYNKNTDQHDLIYTLFLRGDDLEALLARETGSDILVRDPLHTELGVIATADRDLRIDDDKYYTTDNDLGVSLDMYGKILIAGVTYYSSSIKTGGFEYSTTGSLVEVYDFSRTEQQSNSDPYVYTLHNPDPDVSSSFGTGVTLNESWLAVGSPLVSASYGMVYIYQNMSTGSGNYSWSLYQKIESPNKVAGQQFGRSLELNKHPSYSGSMIVGCGLTSSNEAYYFELTGGIWSSSYVFRPTTDIHPLTFGNYAPYAPTMSINSGYGYDVSIYGPDVIIGAHADRTVYEFTGSYQYEQGAVYIYDNCEGILPRSFRLVLKTYGTPLTLKNNRLGYAVDMFGNYAAAGIPKTDLLALDPCYIKGTLGQLQYCDQDLENSLNGQVMLLQKNTSSLDWEIVNVYQKRKRFLSPHRNFGQEVSIGGRSMVVGAPIYYSGSREFNLQTTKSNGVDIDDITGKAYIYNLPNLREEFHVGNVFYRNGKIVLMTSGSEFSGLLLNTTNYRPYEYDLVFDSQHTIHEKQIMCSVEPGEFNTSTNPTALIKVSASLDLNRNGVFDFQDVDVLLRYMNYKELGTMDWSSSMLSADDEISFYNYNASLWEDTDTLWSASYYRFEHIDTTFLDTLDANYDNRVDRYDMNILWKYFSNRLTENNFAGYVNQNCVRSTITEVVDYLDYMTKRNELPQILPEFLDYDQLSAADKTGSYLAPMVTAIGLYDGLDLVAVAKLGAPIKLPRTLPINFVIKMDF